MKNQKETEGGDVVLITGCSSGIGLALAKVFYLQQDSRVIITARPRSIGVLHKLFTESDRVIIRELDITDDKNISHLITEVFLKWRRIDILINNAGICYRSVVEHMDEESELHQLKTNYLGPMSLIRAILPAMRDRGFGHIVNISSASGMLSMPTMGSYSASKSALQSASEALWYELKPFGVKVSIVQPGFVNSNSFNNVCYPKKAQLSLSLDAPYSSYYTSFSRFVAKLMKLSPTNPDQIAQQIAKLVRKKNPPLWIPVSVDIQLYSFLRFILPQKVFHPIMFKLLPNPSAWIRRQAASPSLEETSERIF
ncbi:MAG: SDR family oxidoreductase [Bdellovibrio sp.]